MFGLDKGRERERIRKKNEYVSSTFPPIPSQSFHHTPATSIRNRTSVASPSPGLAFPFTPFPRCRWLAPSLPPAAATTGPPAPPPGMTSSHSDAEFYFVGSSVNFTCPEDTMSSDGLTYTTITYNSTGWFPVDPDFQCLNGKCKRQTVNRVCRDLQ